MNRTWTDIWIKFARLSILVALVAGVAVASQPWGRTLWVAVVMGLAGGGALLYFGVSAYLRGIPLVSPAPVSGWRLLASLAFFLVWGIFAGVVLVAVTLGAEMPGRFLPIVALAIGAIGGEVGRRIVRTPA